MFFESCKNSVRPYFSCVVEWADPEAFAAIIAAATSEQSEIDDEVPRIAARPLRDILDDDIPF